MKILQISSAKHFGGGERHFVDLSRGLINQGHKIFVALRPTNEWQARLDFVPPENYSACFSAQFARSFERSKNRGIYQLRKTSKSFTLTPRAIIFRRVLPAG
ncbi:MAG: hypothetical protein WKF71_12375 [Pyrinomonadaceae bacterium]